MRALAVTLVVVYHLFPTRLQGGYIGVDVFFVISGFLMTQNILRLRRTREAPGAVLREFYARRVRRILPASLFVLLVVALTTLLLPQTLWRSYFLSILASALYVQNWWQAANTTDYLAAVRDSSPVLHFWSLSVEEQFYIFWPLLLVAATSAWAYRHIRRPVVTAIVLTISVSLIYSIWATHYLPVQSYYDTGTRLWELAAGGLVAISTDGLRSPRAAGLLAWSGLALIAISAYFFTGETAFPGWLALLPITGTALIIISGNRSRGFGLQRLFHLRPVQFLGDISYSIYLWHWPLIVLLRRLTGQTLDLQLKLVVVAASIVLAYLTKRYIEDPMRKAGAATARPPRAAYAIGATRPYLAITLLTVMTVIVSVGGTATIGISVERANLAYQRFVQSPPACFGATTLDASVSDECSRVQPGRDIVPDPLIARTDFPIDCQQRAARSAILSCRFGSESSHGLHVALVGDSHATQWVPALAEVAMRNGWTVTTYLGSSCALTTATRDNVCHEWNSLVTKELVQHRYQYVLVTSRSLYGTELDDVAALDAAADGQSAMWREIEASGADIVPIRDTPQPINTIVGSVPDCLHGSGDPDSCTFDRALGEQGDSTLTAAIRSGFPVVDLNDYFCPGTACPPAIGGVLVYMDDNHMSALYSRSLADPLKKALDAVGVRG